MCAAETGSQEICAVRTHQQPAVKESDDDDTKDIYHLQIICTKICWKIGRKIFAKLKRRRQNDNAQRERKEKPLSLSLHLNAKRAKRKENRKIERKNTQN